MRLKARFRVPKINAGKFEQALHHRLTHGLAEGARAYLEAVVPPDRYSCVPVWSGASRATFAELASKVEYALILNPEFDAPNRVSLGESMGSATFNAGTTTPGLYTFVYETTLPHLLINEYYNANDFLDKDGKPYFHLKHPGPYHFQEKGRAAFESYAQYVVLPGWGSLLDVAEIRVG